VRRRLVLLALLALTVAATAGSARAGDGLLTFTQQERFDGELFGTALVGLAPNATKPIGLPSLFGAIGGASWSGTGDTLALATDAAGQWQVVVVGAFTAGYLDPTSHDDQFEPALSPDGKTVVLVDQPYGGRMHLALYNTGGGVAKGLLTDASSDAREPHWSPDGKQIAFSSNRLGSWNAYVMNADGSGVRAVAPTPSNQHVTDWSPDGKSLLVTGDAAGNQDVYLLDAASGAAKQLTQAAANDVAGTFSPSGTKIAFSSDRRQTFDVYVMNLDGSGFKALTDDKGRDIVLDWQQRPNGNAPHVTVQPAKLVRGKSAKIRFSVKDDDQYASVQFSIAYRTGDGGGQISFSGNSPKVRADGSVNTYTLRTDIVSELVSRGITRMQFCVDAIDPYFNGPSQGCAKVTPPPAKKPKKK